MLASEPMIGPLIAGTRPVGRVVGTVKERFFFRREAGAGWVLVGDAGHHKDFVIGDGITEALLQARTLVTAVTAGTREALTRWWYARDVAAVPWYFFGKEAGAPGPLGELHRVVFSLIDAHAGLKARLFEVIERRRSPFEMITGWQILWWTLVAAARGRPPVIGDLFAAGRRTLPIYREWRSRRRLLAALEASTAHPAHPFTLVSE